MSNEEYIKCINCMLGKLSNTQLKKIFDYVHRLYIISTGF